ncbi:MAG: hypothetical protein HOP23_14605 [Methylococcaceae bacterium]|nr:hypothetical protein [Methylococcaceae bacterium]
MKSKQNSCLHYWDLCTVIPIEHAVALWCDVEPSELARLSNYSTSCMDVKRELIEQALYDDKLDYRTTSGAWHNASIDELINKDQVRIKKDSLRRWFLELPTGDRPAFLFDESRISSIPDGTDLTETERQKLLKQIGTLALVLAKQSKKYELGEKPNASQIAEAAQTIFDASDFPGKRGTGSSELRDSIGKGIILLTDE